MRKLMSLSVTAFILAAHTALACQQLGEAEREAVPRADWVIAIARLAQVEPLAAASGQLCLQLGYDLIQPVAGDTGKAFTVRLCLAEAELEQEDCVSKDATVCLREALLGSDGAEAFGITIGSESLVGLVPLNPEAEFRFAIPSCWGPYSLGLKGLSAAERQELLDGIATGLTEAP